MGVRHDMKCFNQSQVLFNSSLKEIPLLGQKAEPAIPFLSPLIRERAAR